MTLRLISLAIIALTGCETLDGVVQPRIVVDAEELCQPVYLFDESYYLPTAEEAQGLARDWIEHIPNRRSSKWDCDDYAQAMCVHLRRSFSHKESDAQSIAVFAWMYGSHAVVKIKTADGDIYVEPQTGEILGDKKEFVSAFKVAF